MVSQLAADMLRAWTRLRVVQHRPVKEPQRYSGFPRFFRGKLLLELRDKADRRGQAVVCWVRRQRKRCSAAVLAHCPMLGLRVDSADDKSATGVHWDEVKAIEKLLQVAERG